MPYTSTKDLKEDVLFRGSEPINSATWGPPVVRFLNRVYKGVCSGASEFLPEYVEDWWWLREHGTLTLEAVTEGAAVTLTQGDTIITFGTTIATSTVGYRLMLDGYPESYVITTHTAGTNTATIDLAYTGESIVRSYRLMKVEYTLPSTVAALISPMVVFRGQEDQIRGTSPERMDFLYPLRRLNAGIPEAFALESERVVRFSHGGLQTGEQLRVEYRYRPQVEDLTDSAGSVPLVPEQYRHLLADMALVYLFLAKNDDRATPTSAGARAGMMAMIRENHRRLAKVSTQMGIIHVRPGQRTSRPLRTESGLIIG